MAGSKEAFEEIYEKLEAPWTRTEPPQRLVELVESEKIKPCKAIDIGCGEGFYSIYLASKGFDVLGIDFSEKAIQHARKNASEHGVDAKFQVLDLTELSKITERFDFDIFQAFPAFEFKGCMFYVVFFVTKRAQGIVQQTLPYNRR